LGLFGKNKDDESKTEKFKEKCHFCKMKFDDKTEFLDHVQNLHPIQKECPKCHGIMKVGKMRIDRFDWDCKSYECQKCRYLEFYNMRKGLLSDDPY